MKKVQAGDVSKLSLLYERYHRDLFGYFYRLTHDGAKSEDMVQIVFYRMLKYRSTFKGTGKFIYWMYAIARNVWLDVLQRKEQIFYIHETVGVQERQVDDRNAEEEMIDDERKRMLRQALEKLSPEKRDAIVLSRYQGMKYKEIATISGCTENTVKSRIKRGLEELKYIIQQAENSRL